jgi:uncharacterized protein (TIGR02646 family)
MIRVECPPISANLQAHLTNRRQNGHPWNSLADSQADREIKLVLRRAFHAKCGYCERIEAQTVDHYRPQANDPDARWDWGNFVLACDVCQANKHQKPPFDAQGNWMINPRFDEPLSALYFDYETGTITARPTSASTLACGQATIDRLGFDRRPQLREERRRKLLDVLGAMLDVVQASTRIDSDQAWQHLVDHLSVGAPYLGMIRQLIVTDNDYTPLISALRTARPEFDELIRSWCLPLLTGAQHGGSTQQSSA